MWDGDKTILELQSNLFTWLQTADGGDSGEVVGHRITSVVLIFVVSI